MFWFVQQEPMKALIGFLIAGALFTGLFVVLILTDKGDDDGKSLNMACSVEALKSHIGKQMDPEMSWDQYGITWKIVHKQLIHDDNPSDSAAHRLEALCARLHYTNTECIWLSEFNQRQNGSTGPPPSAPPKSTSSGFEEKDEKVVTLHQ